MARVTFYGKPGCINNEKQKKLLSSAGHSVDDINILNHPWTRESLKPFFRNLPVPSWFNPTAPAITRGGFKPENCTEDEALDAMLGDRLLIRRPLMVIDGEMLAGFSPGDLQKTIGGLEQVVSREGLTLETLDMTTCPNLGSDVTCEPKKEEESWSIWLKEGQQFMKAGSGRKGRFNTIIRYNLLAMAFEKFVMAILGYHMALPLNHTFTDLIEALEGIRPLDPETREILLGLEKRQEICSFENVVTGDVSEEDIQIMAETIGRFESMAENLCPVEKAPVMLPMG
jgi:nitrogenase-associated protein